MMDPKIDFSIQTLMTMCKGNVKNLPSFMVHDDAVWPNGSVQTDSRGRIHMRRSTFNRVVAGQVPIRDGIWHRIDLQEFHFDLQPHHLQGSADMVDDVNKRQVARVVGMKDNGLRPQGDADYGDTVARNNRGQDVERDRAIAKASGTSGSVSSTVFNGIGTES